MPNNFAHVGLIQLVLPNAKIVDARRHPVGCCFSAFKQHFATGQAFAYAWTTLPATTATMWSRWLTAPGRCPARASAG